jgi:hypothetical protein
MINSVRNTVLSVLNKNNYGYISPADFNLYAKNAQLEIFEEYFSNYNKTINVENIRRSGTDYADTSKMLAEALDAFIVQDFLFPVISPNAAVPMDGKFCAPTDSAVDSSLAASLQNIGGEAYMINRFTCWSQITSGTDSGLSGVLQDTTKDFIALGVKPGDFLIDITNNRFTTVSSVIASDIIVPNDDYFGASNLYKVLSSTEGYDPERVTNGNIRMLNSSLLTKPNTLFPAYTQDEMFLNYLPPLGPRKVKTVSVYPTSISGYGSLHCTYFRYPKDPKWTYVQLQFGEPSFDPTALDYQDFELAIEDEYKLATRILQYCGMSIREGEVARYASMEEQVQQPSFMPQS